MTKTKLKLGVLAALALLCLITIGLQDFTSSAGCCMALGAVALTEEQVKEFKELMDTVGKEWSRVRALPEQFEQLKGLPERLKASESERDSLRKEVGEIRKLLSVRALAPGLRIPGIVSDDCARHLAGVAICGHLRRGGDIPSRKTLEVVGRDCFMDEGQFKAALTTSDIPLPTIYSGEVVELVSQFGTARRYGTVYPLGSGTVKLPKLSTDPVFTLNAVSATVGEKSPQIAFVTFTAEKFGGMIRLPSEIDADSVVALGQFIARYAARQIASVEDSNFWVGTGAGSGVNGSVAGLTASTITNSKVVQMATGNTHYSDVTLVYARQLRSVPDEAAIRTGKYFAHTTFEQKFAGFNTAGDKPYQQNGVNGASLDGFPIVWIPSLPAYSVSANVSKVFLLFGDPSYQYLGVRGGIRMETSMDAGFTTDEILIRCLERFTIGLMANGSMAGLETSAS